MTTRVVLLLTGDYVLTVALVKGTLLVLALLLIRLLVGRRSAATRSALWTVAAAGLLMLPVLQYLLPVRPLSLLAFPTFLFQHDADSFGWATSLPLAVWMAIVWCAGVVLLLGRFIRHLIAVRRLALDSDPMPRTTLRRALTEGDGRTCGSVRVRYSRSVTSPVTFGWWRPTILLPFEARTWPPEWLASALSHELAHVRRRDYLVLVLTEVLRAVYWPNPLIWRVTNMVRAELEHACDDAVLRGGVNRTEYARHLLELASCQRMAPTVGAADGTALVLSGARAGDPRRQGGSNTGEPPPAGGRRPHLDLRRRWARGRGPVELRRADGTACGHEYVPPGQSSRGRLMSQHDLAASAPRAVHVPPAAPGPTRPP